MSAELPPGWVRSSLREVAADGVFADGDWVESKDQDPNGGVRLIQLADIGVARFLDKSSRFLTESKAAELGCTFLERGDVLVSRMADPIGRACVFPGLRQRSVTVVDVCIVRPTPTVVDNRWLTATINSPQFRGAIELAASGTTRSRVSRGNLGKLELPLPPLGEQRRIVAKLEALQAPSRRAREALDAVPRLLEKLCQSILAAAFRGDLTKDWRAKNKNVEPASKLLERIRAERRKKWEEAEFAKMEAKGKALTDDKWKSKYKEPAPVDATELPELPKGWCWTTFDTVGEIDLGRQRAPQYQTGRFTRPYLRVANVKDDRLALDDVLEMDFDPEDFEHYHLRPGDILISEGQSPELVGQSAIYRGGIDGLCFQKTLHRFRSVSGGPSPEFAQLVCRLYLRNGTFRAASSLTVNIAHLTLVRLKPLHFPLPPLDEQAEIVRRVGAALAAVAALEAHTRHSRKALMTLERAVLAKAFRGQLVLRDSSDTPDGIDASNGTEDNDRVGNTESSRMIHARERGPRANRVTGRRKTASDKRGED